MRFWKICVLPDTLIYGAHHTNNTKLDLTPPKNALQLKCHLLLNVIRLLYYLHRGKGLCRYGAGQKIDSRGAQQQ